MENKPPEEKYYQNQREHDEKKPRRRYRQRGQEELSSSRMRIMKPLSEKLNVLAQKMNFDDIEMVIEELVEDFIKYGDSSNQNKLFFNNCSNER